MIRSLYNDPPPLVSLSEKHATNASTFQIRRAKAPDIKGIRDLVYQGLLQSVDETEKYRSTKIHNEGRKPSNRRTPSFILDFLSNSTLGNRLTNSHGMFTFVAEQKIGESLSYSRCTDQDDRRRGSVRSNGLKLLSGGGLSLGGREHHGLSPASSESTTDTAEWNDSVSCNSSPLEDIGHHHVGSRRVSDSDPLSRRQSKMRLWLKQAANGLKEKIDKTASKVEKTPSRAFINHEEAARHIDIFASDNEEDAEAFVNVDIDDDNEDSYNIESTIISGCLVLATTESARTLVSQANELEIRMLAVAQPRAGCATALVEAAKEFAFSCRATCINVLVPRESKSAQLFYLRRGFARVRERDVNELSLKAFAFILTGQTGCREHTF